MIFYALLSLLRSRNTMSTFQFRHIYHIHLIWLTIIRLSNRILLLPPLLIIEKDLSHLTTPIIALYNTTLPFHTHATDLLPTDVLRHVHPRPRHTLIFHKQRRDNHLQAYIVPAKVHNCSHQSHAFPFTYRFNTFCFPLQTDSGHCQPIPAALLRHCSCNPADDAQCHPIQCLQACE